MEYVKIIECCGYEYKFMEPIQSSPEILGICYCNEGYQYLILKNGKYGLGKGDTLSIHCTTILKTFDTFIEVREYRSELRNDRGFTPRYYNF